MGVITSSDECRYKAEDNLDKIKKIIRENEVSNLFKEAEEYYDLALDDDTWGSDEYSDKYLKEIKKKMKKIKKAIKTLLEI